MLQIGSRRGQESSDRKLQSLVVLKAAAGRNASRLTAHGATASSFFLGRQAPATLLESPTGVGRRQLSPLSSAPQPPAAATCGVWPPSSPLSPLSPLSPFAREGTRQPSRTEDEEEEENTPWAEYLPVDLAQNVSQQELELACDGPPGRLRTSLFRPPRLPLRQRMSNDTHAAVLCCAGCYECMEGPSCLYNRLASELPQRGVTVMQLAYRPPGDDEEEAAEDVMTCIDWLVKQKFHPLILIGWSMGSAAVVEATYLRRHLGAVTAIITLAAQTSGTRNAKNLEVPILALHGEADKVLPAACSKALVQRSQQGTLKLLPHATHRVEGAFPYVLDFIKSHLAIA